MIAVVIAFLALAASAVYAYNTHKIMDGIDGMLESAIKGSFTPERYDETRLSRMEMKLRQFLSLSVLSRERIEKDRETITQVIGDISHQTKTPISNIKLYSELLKEQPLDEDCAYPVAQIAAQAEKLEFLIQCLVKSSRLETGVVRPLPKRDSVEKLLETVFDTFKPKAASRSVTLSIERTEGLIACFDSKWTSEAIGNIVDNAIKYTGKGGHIRLSSRQYELFCRIDVEDDGKGIPESEHAGIFTRFYRGSGALDEEGLGLGLYLSRQIVSLQGGYIRVKSAAGKGSMFSVFLPVESR